MSYNYIAFQKQTTTTSLDQIEKRLKEKFSATNWQIDLNETISILNNSGWKMSVREVPSIELSDLFNTTNFLKLANSTADNFSSAFELTSDPDWDMDFFNDCIFALEVLESFNGVVLYNLLAEELV